MCGVSSSAMNIIFGLFTNAIFSIFCIYQFIQLSYDHQLSSIHIIVAFWAVSKFLCLIQLAKKCEKDMEMILYYLFCLIFQGEWLMYHEDTFRSTLQRIIIQLLFSSLPVSLVNIYLLSDQSSGCTHGYYTAMIVINNFLLGMYIYPLIMKYTKQFEQYNYLYSIFCMLTHFTFSYLLIQSFLYNIYIGISLLIFNFIVGVIDSIFSYKDSNGLVLNIFQYIFQIPFRVLNPYSVKKNDIQLEEWWPIIRQGVSSLNLVILTVLKLNFYPLIIKLDIFMYVILVLTLPSLYLLIINIYYKTTKVNSYSLKLKLDGEHLCIQKEALTYLKDRFVGSYQVNIVVDSQKLANPECQQLCRNMSELKQLTMQAEQTKQHDSTFEINDTNKSFSLNLSYKRGYCQSEELVSLNQNFFEDYTNKENLRQLFYLLNISKQYIKIQIQGHTGKLVQDLLLQFQGFESHQFEFCEKRYYDGYLYESALQKIMCNNYQVLAFNKHISTHMTFNPREILFDLYED